MDKKTGVDFPFAAARYDCILSFYWMAYCVALNFASVYLLSRSFSNSEIGVLLALINMLAVLLQPAMASFVDRSARVSLKGFIAFTGAAIGLISLSLLFSRSKAADSLLYVSSVALLLSVQPLINAMCFRYRARGVKINFGVARGLGSGLYALLAIVLGKVVERFGASLLPAYTALSMLFFFLLTYSFAPRRGGGEEAGARAGIAREREGARPLREMLSRYRPFFLYAAGASLVFIPHSIISSYMYQVVMSLGGGSAEMGVAAFIAALVELPVMFSFDRLRKKIDCTKLLRLAAVMFSVQHLLTYFCASVPAFYLIQVLQIGAFGLYVPASAYYVDQVMDRRDLIMGQAVCTGAMTVGSILSSLLGGILLDHMPVKTILLLGGLISIAGTALMLSGIRPRAEGVAR